MIKYENRLNGLHPDLIAFAQDLANETSKVLQRDILISEGYRSALAQEAYYAQGRKSITEVNALRRKAGIYELANDKDNFVITWALPCESPHQHHMAFDVYVLSADGKKLETDKSILDKFYTIKKNLASSSKYANKIELGLNWAKYGQLDPPHVEIKDWRKLADFNKCKQGLTQPQASGGQDGKTDKNAKLFKLFGALAILAILVYLYTAYGKK